MWNLKSRITTSPTQIATMKIPPVYADEQLADEPWLQNYNREEQERLEEEEKFNNRLNGLVEFGEW